MKEIRAYVHRSRIADVVAALRATWVDALGSDHNLAVYVVKGLATPRDDQERRFSMELGDEVINEFKLEFLCEDALVDEMVTVISKSARTGQPTSGWIVVIDVARSLRIV